MRKALFFLSV
jgi:hypothetical protein